VISTIEQYTPELVFECVIARGITWFRRKTVPGSWTRVAETILGACSWQVTINMEDLKRTGWMIF